MKISFKQFLRETVQGTPSESIKHTAELIKKHCSAYLENAQYPGGAIWRYDRDELPSGVYDPSAGNRTSANTSNFYTVFFDTNQKNTAWPKRSKSLICTNSFKTARAFGENVYEVFPFDDNNIGIVGEVDLWEAMIKFNVDGIVDMDVERPNKFWRNIIALHTGKKIYDSFEVPTLEEMIDIVKGLDPADVIRVLIQRDFISTDGDDDANHYSPDRKKKIVDSFADYLPMSYSWDKMSTAQLVKAANFRSDKSEVWMSGKAVLVSKNDLTEVRNALGLGEVKYENT